jgi:hypothetical protein
VSVKAKRDTGWADVGSRRTGDGGCSGWTRRDAACEWTELVGFRRFPNARLHLKLTPTRNELVPDEPRCSTVAITSAEEEERCSRRS